MLSICLLNVTHRLILPEGGERVAEFSLIKVHQTNYRQAQLYYQAEALMSQAHKSSDPLLLQHMLSS
jgi:hypothetical protein